MFRYPGVWLSSTTGSWPPGTTARRPASPTKWLAAVSPSLWTTEQAPSLSLRWDHPATSSTSTPSPPPSLSRPVWASDFTKPRWTAISPSSKSEEEEEEEKKSHAMKKWNYFCMFQSVMVNYFQECLRLSSSSSPVKTITKRIPFKCDHVILRKEHLRGEKEGKEREKEDTVFFSETLRLVSASILIWVKS